MSFFQQAPKPKSLLGYHRVLAPTAGVKVSPICLGAMNFGNGWKEFMGECDKDTSFEVMDSFFDLGGNFIDTANAYQCEESEEWIGEWMEKRGNRDQMLYVADILTSTMPKKRRGKANYMTLRVIASPQSTQQATATTSATKSPSSQTLSATPSSRCAFPSRPA